MSRRPKQKNQLVDYEGWVLLALQVRPILIRASHNLALDAFDRILISLKAFDYATSKQYLPPINEVLETFLLGDEWQNELLLRYAKLHDELQEIRVVVQLGLFHEC